MAQKILNLHQTQSRLHHSAGKGMSQRMQRNTLNPASFTGTHECTRRIPASSSALRLEDKLLVFPSILEATSQDLVNASRHLQRRFIVDLRSVQRDSLVLQLNTFPCEASCLTVPRSSIQ